MKFAKYFPSERLKSYIQCYVVSENELSNAYKVLPLSGLVIGFQYKGNLSIIENDSERKLSSAGVTGISDGFKIFKNTADTGTVLIYFSEIGFAHFSTHPANELFNLSLSLDDIFGNRIVNQVEERLSLANTDKQRIKTVEQFLISQLRDLENDKVIMEAVKLIYESKGTIMVRELNEKLCISQSPFEKRFRKMVGTSPKKFSSIVRFNAVLEDLNQAKSLTEICYENNFFDQAHFIKDFKNYTGQTPENFKRLL